MLDPGGNPVLKTGSLFLVAAAIAGAAWKEDLLEAEVRLKGALRELEQSTGPNGLEAARVLSNLAALHLSSGKLTEGESASLRAEGIYKDIDRQTDKQRAGRGSNRQILASIYLGQRRYADAGKLLRNMLQEGDDRLAANTYAN